MRDMKVKWNMSITITPKDTCHHTQNSVTYLLNNKPGKYM